MKTFFAVLFLAFSFVFIAPVFAGWTDSGNNTYFNGGNVGIGTLNPLSKFHVMGDARFEDSTVRITGSSQPYPNNRALLIYANGESPNFRDQVAISSALPPGQGYGIAFSGRGHHRAGIYAENAGDSASSLGNLGLWARGGGSIFLEAGKIGVGTRTPTEQLEVAGNAKINGDIQLSGNLLSDGDICIGNCSSQAGASSPGIVSIFSPEASSFKQTDVGDMFPADLGGKFLEPDDLQELEEEIDIQLEEKMANEVQSEAVPKKKKKKKKK